MLSLNNHNNHRGTRYTVYSVDATIMVTNIKRTTIVYMCTLVEDMVNVQVYRAAEGEGRPEPR
jgi:hypothetical protein